MRDADLVAIIACLNGVCVGARGWSSSRRSDICLFRSSRLALELCRRSLICRNLMLEKRTPWQLHRCNERVIADPIVESLTHNPSRADPR
jgi:hypothetical protein